MRNKKQGLLRKALWVIIGLVVILFVWRVADEEIDTYKRKCIPNGQQRMVNTFDGIRVEDQLICKDGRTKWVMQYN